MDFDFRILTKCFDFSGKVNLEFQRWLGSTKVNGISTDAGFGPLVIAPPYAYVPNGAKQFLERLDIGDRERDNVLLWCDAFDAAGNPLNVLKTIEGVGQANRLRADRIVDLDEESTYIVAVQWNYGRQAKIAGAIGVLLDS